MVDFFIEQGADVHIKTKSGNNLLHIATRLNNLPIIKTLIEQGLPIDEPDATGTTPLLMACTSSSKMLIQLFIDSGANVFVTNSEGLSPIYHACGYNQKEVVKLFLENGLDVNYKLPNSESSSDMGNYLDFVETANNLAMDSAYNLTNSYTYGGESLIHLATKNGQLYMVELLLKRGAEVNIQDESENTPLHYAAANGKKDLVKLLLEQGADVNKVNIKEQKPIDYSNIKGFNEITEMLLQHNGTITSTEMPETLSQDQIMTKLKDLKALLDMEILSQNEFDTKKEALLKTVVSLGQEK